jgi:hypothetical protein
MGEVGRHPWREVVVRREKERRRRGRGLRREE